MIRSFRSHGRAGLGSRSDADLIRQAGSTTHRGAPRALSGRVAVSRGVVAGRRGLTGLRDVHREAAARHARPRARAASPRSRPALRGTLYQFVAQAVRPDFELEFLGDSVRQHPCAAPCASAFGGPTGSAPAERPSPNPVSRVGTSSAARLATPAAGPDTFYSLRFSCRTPRHAPHARDKQRATRYSRGVSGRRSPVRTAMSNRQLAACHEVTDGPLGGDRPRCRSQPVLGVRSCVSGPTGTVAAMTPRAWPTAAWAASRHPLRGLVRSVDAFVVNS